MTAKFPSLATALCAVGVFVAFTLTSCASTSHRAESGGAGGSTVRGHAGGGESGGATGRPIAGCSGRTFQIDPSANVPSAGTPMQAMVLFKQQGQTVLPGGLVGYGFPATGWHETSHTDSTATLKSGRSTLHLVRLSTRQWQVRSGETCNY